MRLHSLESRVVVLFITLILGVQLAGFFFIKHAISNNAVASVQKQLTENEKVFLRLLDSNAQKIVQGARILSLDYAFREAVSISDKETIKSVLANHGERIGASLSMLIGIDKKITASTSSALAASFQQSILPLITQAEQSGSATSIAIVDGHPYQLVILPVKAPITIAWVVMAVPLDQSVVDDMHQSLSTSQITFLTDDAAKHWNTIASNLDANAARQVAQQLPPMSEKIRYLPELIAGQEEYSARIIPLTEQGSQSTIAVIQISLNEAKAPYVNLQRNLLILTAAFIALAILISIVLTKRITGPLRELANTARRLGAGDYSASISVKRNDEIGDLAQTFMTMRDGIAHRESEIRHLAYWDTLTQLPNRALFVSMLNDAIQQAQTNGSRCFVLMMDLDRFKHVNDVMGHSFGDMLLTQVATRLQAEIQSSHAKLARLGGDEFVILLTDASLIQAQSLANSILLALEKPISLDEQTVDLGAGLGIAGYPENASDAESLLSRAEVAMYAAKRRNSGAVTYVPEIDQSSQQSLSLLSELRAALDHNDFRLFVQPKVALASGKVIAVEALIRWQHPQRGWIYPDQFIPFAEQTGFIRELSRWVINESAGLCHAWLAQGIAIKMSVNLSTRDLMDQDLPNKFTAILEQHQITAASFCLEITESAIMDDPVRAQTTLEKLHAMGLELSIDDFGTGYSSLAYLKTLPVDELKIDKSFVLKMEKDADDTKIVKSTIDLGHNMGLRVVAEGVENLEVMQLLREMGCDHAQGYFISRPMPAVQFLDWLSNWKSPY